MRIRILSFLVGSSVLLSGLVPIARGQGPGPAVEPSTVALRSNKAIPFVDPLFKVSIGFLRLGNAVATWPSRRDWDKARERGETLELVIKEYESQRDGGRAVADLAEGFHLVAAAGAVAAAPLTAGQSLLAFAAASQGISIGGGVLREQMDKSARQYLRTSIRGELPNYAELAGSRDIERVRTALDKLPAFQRAKESLRDDPEAREIFESRIVETLAGTTVAVIDKVEANTADIALLGRAVSRFQKETKASLDSMAGQLQGVRDDLAQANKDIAELRADTLTNSNDLLVIEDILFRDATPADKLRLLDTQYGKSLSSEQQAKLRSTLKTQVKLESLHGSAQKALGYVNGAATVLAAVGVRLPPDVNEGLRIANGAMGAAAKAMSGDYFGAVVGLVGLFGKPQPDPTMAALTQGFSQVQAQLAHVMELQVQTLEAIETLSKELREYHAETMQRFDNIEHRLDNIQTLQWMLFRRDEIACITFTNRMKGGVPTIRLDDPNTYTELGLQDLTDCETCRAYLDTSYSGAFHAEAEFETLAARYRTNLDDNYRSRSSAAYKDTYDTLYKPAFDYLKARRHKLKSNDGSEDVAVLLLQGLALPVATVADVKKKILTLQECKDAACFSTPLRGLVVTQGDAGRLQERIDGILDQPVIFDYVDQYAEYAMLVAPIADATVRDPGGQFRVARDLAELQVYYETYRGEPGRRLIAKALQVSTVAVAQQNLMSGDLLAFLVFDDLWDRKTKAFKTENELTNSNTGTLGDPARLALDLIRNNPIVARNVLMFALDDALSRDLRNKQGAYLAYSAALQAASDHPPPGNARPDEAGNGDRDALQAASEREAPPAPSLRPLELLFPAQAQPTADGAAIPASGLLFTRKMVPATGRPPELNSDALPNDVSLSAYDRWKARHDTATTEYNNKTVACANAGDGGANASGCVGIPSVILYGQSVRLPSVEDFRTRAIIYPPELLRSLQITDRLAACAADYGVLNTLWNNTPPADRPALRAKLSNLFYPDAETTRDPKEEK